MNAISSRDKLGIRMMSSGLLFCFVFLAIGTIPLFFTSVTLKTYIFGLGTFKNIVFVGTYVSFLVGICGIIISMSSEK